MAINQAYIFLLFTLNGVIIGLFFDFFRILRKSFKTKNIVTYIEDGLFWILTGISIIYFMYKFSDGNLRLYMVIGLSIGFILYLLVVSKTIINIFVKIIDYIKKTVNIILVPIQKIWFVFYKMMLSPLNTLFEKIHLYLTKKLKK